MMPVPEDAATRVPFLPRQSTRQHFYSAKFQWLPCEVAFVDESSVKITSYINNLQPKKHKELYEVLERVIAKTIPMWNAALESTQAMNKEPRIDLGDMPWIDPEGEPPRGEDFDEWREANRTLVPPNPDSHSTPGNRFGKSHNMPIPVDLRKTFTDHGLQVIVKLANIHLTPEKSSYDGGTWHIEGQLNEHICASALYYYDSDNITDSYLSFRETTDRNWLWHRFRRPGSPGARLCAHSRRTPSHFPQRPPTSC
jgi:hypothetical protein